MGRFTNTITLLTTLAFALMATACDRSESTSTGAGGGGGISIVYIAKSTGNPYFDPLIEGIRKSAEENGATFTTVSPATADATSQLPLIKDQIQRKVSVIVISPNSPDALNPVLKEAMGKGIRVVTVDSDLIGNEQFRTAAVLPTDPVEIGKGQIELMGSLIEYKGKFAILSATTDAPNQNEWIGHMKEALKDPKYKQMELVEIVYGDDAPQKSTTVAEALLAKYPDLRGIIAPTSVGVVAAAQVVESAKRSPQVQVTGLGTPNQMRRFIQNGTVKAFALWSPHDEGYVAGHLAHQVATGKITPAPGGKFTVPNLGEREFRANNVVITGPPVVFTKENIEQYKF